MGLVCSGCACVHIYAGDVEKNQRHLKTIVAVSSLFFLPFVVSPLLPLLRPLTLPSQNLLLFIANSFRHTWISHSTSIIYNHKRANAVRHSKALGSQLPLPGDVVNDETT